MDRQGSRGSENIKHLPRVTRLSGGNGFSFLLSATPSHTLQGGYDMNHRQVSSLLALKKPSTFFLLTSFRVNSHGDSIPTRLLPQPKNSWEEAKVTV